MSNGTGTDATILVAPSSTNNRANTDELSPCASSEPVGLQTILSRPIATSGVHSPRKGSADHPTRPL